MKQSDYPRLKKELTLLLPIHQTDAWKKMNISHQDMSDLVENMISQKLIKRNKVKLNTYWTYLLESTNNGKFNNRQNYKKTFSHLLVRNIFSPCTGCYLECNPVICQKLSKWVCTE